MCIMKWVRRLDVQLLISGTMPEEMPTPKNSLKELEKEKKQIESKEKKKFEGIK